MTTRASRAGSRQTKYRHKPGFGRLADNKLGFLVTSVTRQLTIQALNPEEFDEDNEITMNSERGDNVLLLIPLGRGRSRPLIWNLSAMTSAELEATRQFFNYLFDLADPIVRERDKVAEDAQAAGDDTYIRNYRALPQFVARPRKEPTDSQGVQHGPENAADPTGD